MADKQWAVEFEFIKLCDNGDGTFSPGVVMKNPTAAPGATYTPAGFDTPGSVLTRPADTNVYTQYDLISNSTSAALPTEVTNAIRFAGESLRMEGVRLRSTNPLAKGKTFRVHLWRQLPTLSVNDNGAFNVGGLQTLAVTDIVGHLGYVDVLLEMAGTTGAKGFAALTQPIVATPSTGTSIFWTLEVRDASGYTPISAEQFSLAVNGARS